VVGVGRKADRNAVRRKWFRRWDGSQPDGTGCRFLSLLILLKYNTTEAFRERGRYREECGLAQSLRRRSFGIGQPWSAPFHQKHSPLFVLMPTANRHRATKFGPATGQGSSQSENEDTPP